MLVLPQLPEHRLDDFVRQLDLIRDFSTGLDPYLKKETHDDLFDHHRRNPGLAHRPWLTRNESVGRRLARLAAFRRRLAEQHIDTVKEFVEAICGRVFSGGLQIRHATDSFNGEQIQWVVLWM